MTVSDKTKAELRRRCPTPEEVDALLDEIAGLRQRLEALDSGRQHAMAHLDHVIHGETGTGCTAESAHDILFKAAPQPPAHEGDVPDTELPGLWTYSDFTGGETDQSAAEAPAGEQPDTQRDEALDSFVDEFVDELRNEAVERYIRSLEWSDHATDNEKTLVAGNIRTFANWYREAVRQQSRVPDEIRAKLRDVHSTLDELLGDSDADWFETDERMKEQVPLQWAAKEIAALIYGSGDE